MRENLAELCHSQWSGWMKYLFEKGTFNVDGTWTMPKWAVERWSKQMNTQYSELSAAEMDSDRAEADKFIALISRDVICSDSMCDYCSKVEKCNGFEDAGDCFKGRELTPIS